jgi:hypothetical protein
VVFRPDAAFAIYEALEEQGLKYGFRPGRVRPSSGLSGGTEKAF